MTGEGLVWLRGPPEIAIASIVAAALTSAVLILWARRTASPSPETRNPLPPSPPGKWPILGHLPLLASAGRPDHLLDRLAEELGPVFHLQLGNATTVVISNEKLARESLIKKGRTYAGRWGLKVLMELSDGGRDIAMAQYGEPWRKMRRIVHKILTPLALDSMDARLEIEAIRILQHIFDGMDRLGGDKSAGLPVQPLFAAFSTNIILSKSLGMTFESPDHPLCKFIMRHIEDLFALAGVGGLEDYFPGGMVETIVMFRKSKTLGRLLQEFREGFLKKNLLRIKKELGDEIASGRNPWDRDLAYAEELILNMEKDGLEIEDIRGFLMDILTAGIDTTSCTLHWAVLHLINRPDIQTRMHQEIDEATGGKRLPSLKDMNAMPLLRAVIKEITRLVPAGPLGLPRMTTEEDGNLGGYYVPAGAQVIYNLPAINRSMVHQDEEPNMFNPDRWLNNGTGTCPHKDDAGTSGLPCGRPGRSLDILESNYTFGQGRRLCPGVHLAYREMFLALSGIMAFFRIESVDGKPLSTDSAFGLTVLPTHQVSARFVDRGSPLRAELATMRRQLEMRLQKHVDPSASPEFVPAAA